MRLAVAVQVSASAVRAPRGALQARLDDLLCLLGAALLVQCALKFNALLVREALQPGEQSFGGA